MELGHTSRGGCAVQGRPSRWQAVQWRLCCAGQVFRSPRPHTPYPIPHPPALLHASRRVGVGGGSKLKFHKPLVLPRPVYTVQRSHGPFHTGWAHGGDPPQCRGIRPGSPSPAELLATSGPAAPPLLSCWPPPARQPLPC